MARHPGIVVRALSWNLFHGRDFPPDGSAAHVDARRPLRAEFERVLAAPEWDVALLQEAPPRWLAPLRRATGADGASALTSRNQLAALRAAAAWLAPDLIRSNEGGSNQLLVRAPWRGVELRRHTLARRPERRRMLWARLAGPDGRTVAVANLHGTTGDSQAAQDQVVAAAERAVEWAGPDPLLFGGDLNLRLSRTAAAFERLEALGLRAPTARTAIDHLLVRGLHVVEPPRALPPEGRELRRADGALLRLSDHAPVVASFEVE